MERRLCTVKPVYMNFYEYSCMVALVYGNLLIDPITEVADTSKYSVLIVLLNEVTIRREPAFPDYIFIFPLSVIFSISFSSYSSNEVRNSFHEMFYRKRIAQALCGLHLTSKKNLGKCTERYKQ